MSVEIERKFLVINDDYKRMASASHRIVQGYLSTDPQATVRVRVLDNLAFVTIKSKTVGCSRGEWEYPVPVADAEEMLALCRSKIEKTRWIVPFGGRTWEVDEFGGRLHGLILAEIELPSEDAPYDLPSFAGRDVTGDPQYYNSNLAQR